jgi:hypothetical protein
MILIPSQQRTVVSRDVNFEEEFASKMLHYTLLVTENEEWDTLVKLCSFNHR